MFATLGLAGLAGILSVLSPCVLPLLPIVFATAASEGRYGAPALAAGLTLSFTAIGMFVATIGFSIGLDIGVFRVAAAIIFLAIGLTLLVPMLQTRLAAAGGPLIQWTDSRVGRLQLDGPKGQFALGLILGAVWIPCVGPTLGAASLLAARREDLGDVALTMIAFGIGAAIPLAALGMISRQAFARWRGRAAGLGQAMKLMLGGVLVAVGLFVLSGVDKRIETLLVESSPAWLTELTTRF